MYFPAIPTDSVCMRSRETALPGEPALGRPLAMKIPTEVLIIFDQRSNTLFTELMMLYATTWSREVMMLHAITVRGFVSKYCLVLKCVFSQDWYRGPVQAIGIRIGIADGKAAVDILISHTSTVQFLTNNSRTMYP